MPLKRKIIDSSNSDNEEGNVIINASSQESSVTSEGVKVKGKSRLYNYYAFNKNYQY